MQAIIFRHQLFKISEPFITQQAGALKKYSPIYLGRSRFSSAPHSSTSLALSDIPTQRSFARRFWQVLTRDPKPYQVLLSEKKPLLIHAHFGVEGVYALPVANRLNLPLVTTFHGFDATTSLYALFRSGSPSWINYALFRKQLAKKGDLFLCVSEFIRAHVLAMGYPKDRTFVHYIGIDTHAIQPRLDEQEKPIILHVARLVEKKGTEYLIRAFAKIEKQIQDAQLMIIGEGPLEYSLRELAENLNISEKVVFRGALPHSEVMTCMSSSSILVLPSITAKSGDAEGLGMVLLEASAMGIPLIGTHHGGIPEVIEDGNTGYLVPERDTEILADRIFKLMSNPSQRKHMGFNARKLVETKFNIHTQSEKLQSFYDGLLK